MDSIQYFVVELVQNADYKISSLTLKQYTTIGIE